MNIADWIQLGMATTVLLGVFMAYLQLRSISRSLRLSQQANAVQVIAHCSAIYEMIMGQLPETDSASDLNIWWYRYWDAVTMEFNFFVKGMLDPDIFQLWMTELANVYNLSPKSGMEKRVDKHKEHLANTIPHYELIHNFFNRIEHISSYKDAKKRAELVDELIEEYRPKDSLFDKFM